MASKWWHNKTFSETISYLSKLYNLSKSDAAELVSYSTGIPYNKLIFYYNKTFLPVFDFQKILEKLNKQIPVSYITNRREFYGREFYVNNNVLIPRHETEILVETVLKNISCEEGSILDLGTGSGCILVTLLRELKTFEGIGIDNNFNALNIAEKNAVKHDVQYRCQFVCGDMLDCNKMFKNSFDIIICNPPYVSALDEYEKSILSEPKDALFAPDNGLFFYKKLLSKLNKLCKRDSIIFYEIGNAHKKDLESIYNKKNIQFIKDLAGYDRIMMWKN